MQTRTRTMRFEEIPCYQTAAAAAAIAVEGHTRKNNFESFRPALCTRV